MAVPTPEHQMSALSLTKVYLWWSGQVVQEMTDLEVRAARLQLQAVSQIVFWLRAVQPVVPVVVVPAVRPVVD